MRGFGGDILGGWDLHDCKEGGKKQADSFGTTFKGKKQADSFGGHISNEDIATGISMQMVRTSIDTMQLDRTLEGIPSPTRVPLTRLVLG